MDKIKCNNCGAGNLPNSKFCKQCGYSLPQTDAASPDLKDTFIAPVNNNNRKKITGIIVGVLVFAVSYWGVQQLFFKAIPFDKVMMQVASEINKTCPIMVDEQTRLDNTIALPDNSFQYNYTLVKLTKDEVDIERVKEYIEPGIVNNIKTNPDMKIYRDNKTTMIYYYKDKNGEFVHKFSVSPDMYE